MKTRLIAAMSLALTLAASPAMAACVQADLAGSFQIFLLWVNHAAYAGSTSCNVRIDKSGKVASGTKCVEFRAGVAATRYTVTGGSFNGKASCRFAGGLDFDDGTTTWRVRIPDAYITADRNLISGVGVDKFWGEDFKFTGIRR